MRDRSGRVIREERAGGRWTEYEYDQRGRLTRSSFSDGTIEAFSYDALGRLTEARNATGSVSMAYDEGGHVVKESFSGGLPGDKGTTVENIYDDLGNRIETRTSLGSVVQNSFDEDGLLSRVTAANGGGENWEEKIIRDSEGLKIEKIFSGGIRMTRIYDAYGNVISQKSRSFRQDGYDRRYAWNASGRLQSVIDGITGGRTTYAYDAVGSLMSARYEDGTDDYRMPDAAGNVFRSRDRRDREYGKGGRILRDRHYDYLYDVEGNLILKTPRRGLTQHSNHEVSEESDTHIAWQTGDYAYEWYGNGMLKEVWLPYGKTVRFEYDALGRRTAKLFNGHVFRYLWDGNVMVQEWQYEEKDRPQHSIDEFGRIRMQSEEPVENLVTWVYEEGSYVPVAKIQNGERYTIISDYMGRPVEAYNSYGNVVWQADYDIYGDLRNIKGIRDFIPFRQLGQYEDDETRLYYNRFRYYDPRIGNYISQDPIRLMGNNPTLYGYVGDSNQGIDIFGLSGVPHTTPAWKARSWQGKGDYPGIDTWRTVTLKKGTIVYGGVPGQSEFYIEKASFKRSGGIKETLWESVQVKEHPKFGYRSAVQPYILTEDTVAGMSVTKANPQYGKGGAIQYFIEDYNEKLKPYGDPIELESSKLNKNICK